MKKIVAISLIVMLVVVITACSNKQIVDWTFNFNRAIVSLPNGEIIDGVVQSWKDFEDGDQIQVKIDGITYLVHSANVALMAK